MQPYDRQHSTHSGQLERWLGVPAIEKLVADIKGWYGPPIAVSGVPGSVWLTNDGGFIGNIRGGREVSGGEYAESVIKRELRRPCRRKFYDAFADILALQAAVRGGKSQYLKARKTGASITTQAACAELWGVISWPTAGATGAAAPGGTALTNATAGALPFVNPANANTTHFISGKCSNNVATSLLLIDRLFSVAKTMSSTGTEAVTGTFSRYQNSSATASDYAGGNFCYPYVTSVLPATAHNWTVCQYTDQAGNTAQSFPSIAGVVSQAAQAMDLPVGNWFMPLAAGGVGVKALTQMQCDASITGGVDFVVAHPIAFLPFPIVGVAMQLDGINSALNMTPVFDNACLSFLEINKPQSTTPTYSIEVLLASE